MVLQISLKDFGNKEFLTQARQDFESRLVSTLPSAAKWRIKFSAIKPNLAWICRGLSTLLALSAGEALKWITFFEMILKEALENSIVNYQVNYGETI